MGAFKNVLAFRKDPLALFAEVAKSGEDPAFFDLGVRPACVITSPDVAAQFLKAPHMAHDPRPYGIAGTFRGYRVLQDLIGRGLPVLDGEEGAARRRWVQPGFAHVQRTWITRPDVPARERLHRIIKESLNAHCVDGKSVDDNSVDVHDIDLHRVYARVVFEQLCSVLFGNAYEDASRDITDAIDAASHAGHALASQFLPYAQIFDVGHGREMRRARKTLVAFAARVMNDLQSMAKLTTSVDDDGATPAMFSMLDDTMSREAVRDEILAQLVAGTESTSLSASWTTLLLSQHPSVLERLRTELSSMSDEDRRRQTLQSDSSVARVAKEGLRLFPSFWQFLRVAQQDTTVGVHDVKKGTIVFICPYLAHRKANVFANPTAFDPWRDDSANGGHSVDKSAQTLLTFGNGPRSCVGARLSVSLLMESVSAMVTSFDVHPEQTHLDVVPLVFGLKRRGGFAVRLTARATEPVTARARVGVSPVMVAFKDAVGSLGERRVGGCPHAMAASERGFVASDRPQNGRD